MNRTTPRVLQQLACVVFMAPSNPSAIAAAVTGTVVRAESQMIPIANARVTLFEPTLQFFFEARTNEQGTFSFSNLPIVDVWRLGASSLGREYTEIEVVIEGGSFQHTFLLGTETHPGQWNIIGNTLPEFFDATDIAILQTDGRVLYCHDTVDPIVFDPATGQKSFPTGSWSEQGCMNSSLLPDGRIMMIGGQDGSDPGSFTDAIPWVKAYDPQTDTWQDPPDLQHAVGRWYPGLARLADGSFLVMGGGTAPSAQRTDTCERMDLATLAWSYTGSMANPTEFPPSALLYNGKVLATWWPPQLYTPATGLWQPTGNFVQPSRFWPGHSDHSIVVLEDGRVLAVGIVSGPDGNTIMGEVYDPDAELWTLTSNPDLVRFQSEVVQLPDGRILVAGGETENPNPPVTSVLGIVKWCDIYDPPSNSWRRVADLNWHREYHAVTLLVPDGRVLTTGGTRIKFQVGPTSADIEAYSPPYLFRGVRPQITGISGSSFGRGCEIALSIAPEIQITNVVLMGTGVTTHWVDAGIPRRLLLPFQQRSGVVTADLPTDPNVLPLGHYMIFAMVDDIPSIGRIVQVSANAPSSGDVNLDGTADSSDIPIFVTFLLNLSEPSTCQLIAADANSDGELNGLDIAPFVSAVLSSP
ncbi:MAG: hypothetical protein DCC65_08415 [Planctomycetota bacterium]|nr:MAG: hypothetical protein DCC65_08415 [Planctomycetota bacterium]